MILTRSFIEIMLQLFKFSKNLSKFFKIFEFSREILLVFRKIFESFQRIFKKCLKIRNSRKNF